MNIKVNLYDKSLRLAIGEIELATDGIKTVKDVELNMASGMKQRGCVIVMHDGTVHKGMHTAAQVKEVMGCSTPADRAIEGLGELRDKLEQGETVDSLTQDPDPSNDPAIE